MSTILKRAHHVLLIVVATVFGLSLLAPMAALASTDLVAGQQATIANPNGSGANLRSDVITLDDSTLIGELPQGSNVTLIDGPIVTDTGTWFWVVSGNGQEGFVSASLLSAIETAPAEVTDPVAETEPETPVEQPTSPDLLWQEVIDAGFVVDNNNEIPAEGLACRATPTVDGEVLARIPVNATLQVAAPRIWQGDLNFVHVNCGDGAGYVNGKYVVLQSEQATQEEETTTDEPMVEETTTDEAVESVIEEPVVEDVTSDATVPEDTTTDTGDVTTDTADSGDVTTDTTVPEDTTTDAVVSEDDSTDAMTDTTAPEENIDTEVTTDTTVPEEVTTDTETDTTIPEDITTDVETDTAPVEETDTDAATDSSTDAEATEETDTDTTDDVATDTETVDDTATDTETADETSSDVDSTTDSSEEVTTDSETTTDTVEEVTTDTNTGEADDVESDATTEQEPEVQAAAVPATTAPASDISQAIGTATVTGTNGEGLRCRVAPSDDAATLMTLPEGTKVYVLSEAENGYLGIDCGGLQGFADVNYLWSGGAGDEEIQQSNMTVVVTGTGNGLNCRSGAGTSYGVITVLRDGDKIQTRGAATNGWVPVTCAGQNGFVATTYVEPGTTSSAAPNNSNSAASGATTGTATVSGTNGDGLYCRSGAGSSYSVITVLSPGQSVPVRGANQGAWTPVTCGGAAGFAHSDYLTINAGSGSGNNSGTKDPAPAPGASTGTVTVANTGGAGLNCRSGASTSSSVITVLRPGQSVNTRSGSTSGWQAVVCGGQNGFVSSEFVTGGSTGNGNTSPEPETPPASDNTGQTATVSGTNGDGLYCRSGAGSGNSVITVLSPGQSVPVRGANSNGWVPVTCGGKAGWASAEYLTIGSGSTTPSDPKPSEPAPAPSGLQSGDHAQVTENLNLRYEPSLGSGVAAVAPAGTVVLVTSGASNGFYGVDWDGLKGYMSGDYLTATSAALSERGGSANPGTTPPPTNGGSTATGNAMVDYAMGYLGYPYVWATHGPASFDCSGFTYWVAKNVLGIDIGTGTWTQVSAGVRVSRDSLQPGDLVFFQNTYQAGLSHVGLYIGNGQFIHAQNEDTGVVISDLDSSYYGPRWYGAVRLT